MADGCQRHPDSAAAAEDWPSLVIEAHGEELYVEATARIDLPPPDLGWTDVARTDLVLVGENLYLHDGRLGAFATEQSLTEVCGLVRAAYAHYVAESG